MQPANWFLAFVVPEQVGLHNLTADLPLGICRFSPADLHLTVAFLGACEEHQALQSWEAIAALQHPSIVVRAGCWRAMGSPQRPSAYALTLAQGNALTARLIELWRQPAFQAAGLPIEQRAALPHITLARPPRRGGEEERKAMVNWLRQAPVPEHPFLLEQIALYTWATDRSRQRFRIHSRRRLDQAA